MERPVKSDRRILGEPVDEFFIRMEEFHGYRSPGILVGGLMMEAALKRTGPVPYLNVVTETVVCLPDAVQLLTPCTYGNGFLQVLDWGKFALTAYDRDSLRGARAWLNHDLLTDYPLINGWFERTGEKREKPPFSQLAEEILSARPELIRCQQVKLPHPLKNTRPMPTGCCSKCGESYTLHHGSLCPACQGKSYYRLDANKELYA